MRKRRQPNSLIYGGIWFYPGESMIHFSWALLWRAFGGLNVGITVQGEENKVGLAITLPLLFSFHIAMYLTWMERFIPTKEVEIDGRKEVVPCSRSITFSVYEWTMYWNFWIDQEAEWHNSRSWRSGYFCLAGALFGHMAYERKKWGMSFGTILAMPEGAYSVSGQSFVEVGTRPRWPWFPVRTEQKVYSFEFEKPIPIPSHDPGGDGISSISVSAKSIVDALEVVKKRVLMTREIYGGEDWVPEDGWDVKRRTSFRRNGPTNGIPRRK